MLWPGQVDNVSRTPLFSKVDLSQYLHPHHAAIQTPVRRLSPSELAQPDDALVELALAAWEDPTITLGKAELEGSTPLPEGGMEVVFRLPYRSRLGPRAFDYRPRAWNAVYPAADLSEAWLTLTYRIAAAVPDARCKLQQQFETDRGALQWWVSNYNADAARARAAIRAEAVHLIDARRSRSHAQQEMEDSLRAWLDGLPAADAPAADAGTSSARRPDLVESAR